MAAGPGVAGVAYSGTWHSKLISAFHADNPSVCGAKCYKSGVAVVYKTVRHSTTAKFYPQSSALMSYRCLRISRSARVKRALVALASLAMLSCGSSDNDPDDVDDDDDEDPFKSGMCFPDADGLTGGDYTFELTVTDTGFSKMVLSTQDNSMVKLTLKNEGTKPHGFVVGCASVLEAFPNLPAMCPKETCFPGSTPDGGTNDDTDMPAWIDPIEPGESKTITFLTPTTDDVIYPFSSNSPDDEDVEGLNNGQWIIM